MRLISSLKNKKRPHFGGVFLLQKRVGYLFVTNTPGPIVELTEMLCTYTPLEVLGFTRRIVSNTAFAFSANLVASKEALPIMACTIGFELNTPGL